MFARFRVLTFGTIAVLVAGCGGGAATTAPTSAETGGSTSAAITVVAEDIRFTEATYGADAGQVDVAYRNDGAIEHTLVIDGIEGLRLVVPANGDVDEGSVDLQAGEYTMYCDVTGHREAGMEATLEVV